MKSRKIGFLFMTVALLSSVFGWTQEKRTITLKEAIDLGVKNSKQLKTSLLKIEESSAALKESEQKRLPDVGVSGSYMRILTANFDLASSNSGGGGSSSSAPNVNQAMYGIVNASLPIYTGGKIKYGIESSKYLEQAAKLDAENDQDAVIQNTIEAFANLFKAKTAVSLMKENLQESKEREKDFSNLEENGLLARNDLLKAQLQSSNIELNVLDAENNWQMANINMDLMLGIPDSVELELDTTGIEKRDDERTLEDYLQAAMTNRKDMAALDFRKKAAIADVKTTASDIYPHLQLTGGYIAADIPKVLSVTNAINVGVGISYNIGSLWKTKAKVEQSEARAKELAVAEAEMDDNIQLQVNKSYLTLLSNRKKIQVYEKAVEQAEENYKIIKNKFDNNLATATDLLEADVAQFQAKLSYTLARADAFVSYNKLLQTAGILSAELNNKK